LKALSPSGRCRPYDAAADGLLVGEGAAIFVLKRLDDAVRDGDRVYAVIRGIGLSNDLAGSLLAADSEGQLRAMRAAYDDAGWSPSDVQHIEGHGTGTPLGDAVELRSLQTLWTDVRGGSCVIGSVKSNIGHLLTGAGAAGLLKTTLALEHGMLPPTAGFERSSDGVLGQASAFRVLSKAEKWPKPAQGGSRRAAISAFGFGGINAHLLLEEFEGVAGTKSKPTRTGPTTAHRAVAHLPVDVAIVGIGVHVGALTDRRAFQEAVLGGGASAGVPSAIDEVEVPLGAYRLPPSEIPQTLPQQLLALNVVAEALADAGLGERAARPKAGALVGISVDPNTSNFHHRWALPQAARRWAQTLGLALSDAEFAHWIEELRVAAGPALNAPHVMGALGSIAASRIAREFGFGGSSFAISAEEASGIRALEIGCRMLASGELDVAVAAAVDLACDERTVSARHALAAFGSGTPLDAGYTGPRAGDGAVALVLKRLSDAEAAGDRVYAVVRGIGATGGAIDLDDADSIGEAIRRACDEATVETNSIDYIELGDVRPSCDGEVAALADAYSGSGAALGSVTAQTGHCGAATGLLAIAKAALALDQQVLPSLPGYVRGPSTEALVASGLHVPIAPQYWLRDRAASPRRAGVTTVALDGGCMHVVLEEHARTACETRPDRGRPLGHRSPALFAIAGASPAAVMEGLDALAVQSRTHAGHIEVLAQQWVTDHSEPAAPLALAIVAKSVAELQRAIDEARDALSARPDEAIAGCGGIYYQPQPLGVDGEVAWVFPGSGSHYPGMGRGLLAAWPQVARALDAETDALRSQLQPERFVPHRADWSAGWSLDAMARMADDTAALIMGQVAFGVVASDILWHLGVRPTAAIGYSLGETAALFALRAWGDRDEMHRRMVTSPLFRTALAGPCTAARQRWRLGDDESVDWRAAVVNRPAGEVRQVVMRSRRAYLLIANAPNECVIGGERGAVEDAIITLGCEAVDLDGASTVHCPIVEAVADEYRELHKLHTTAPAGVRFYSAAWAKAYPVTVESAADSILAQALGGFDFSAVVQRAYADGVRVFVEIGPGSSCTRMIGKILAGKLHAAVAMTAAGQDEFSTVVHALAALVAHRVVQDLRPLYADLPADVAREATRQVVRVPTRLRLGDVNAPRVAPRPVYAGEVFVPREADLALAGAVADSGSATARAHDAFLRFSQAAADGLGAALRLQNLLLERGGDGDRRHMTTAQRAVAHPSTAHRAVAHAAVTRSAVAYDREMCLEFARGSAARVLGAEFAEVDTFAARVRLPDEPLMLVDRIVEVTGEKGSLTRGTVVTEHDVHPGAWYLDGGRMPVSVTVEAGQADLFLCAYLGIDLAVRGQRVYRLLDATVRFHRDLPAPGEVIRYDIRIDRFVKQGETYLFFFAFEGSIAGVPLLSMSAGCAGFFTADEIAGSGGIIETVEETQPPQRALPDDWRPLAPFEATERYDAKQLAALRDGDLARCFGPAFANLPLQRPATLPSGRLELVHRVTALESRGGRYGLGLIRAEADIHPDDWFLTCHFVDDMVMPGTLMYECCMHTLRIFLMRMGWVAGADAVHYAPVEGVSSSLRCRGPVTPATKVVTYEVHIKEIGYGPEAYAIADALMYGDGAKIVRFADMSVRLVGPTRADFEALWSKKAEKQPVIQLIGDAPVSVDAAPAVFDTDRILACAVGKPSVAFGDLYKPFDSERRLARLPGPPFAVISRITKVTAAPWKLDASGWIEAQYEVPPDAWYFAANRQPTLPFAILLEIALQPCGWLAAYKGSALRREVDMSFRNLGGEATVRAQLGRNAGTLTTRVRLTRVSEAAGMIIEDFDFQVWQAGRPVYVGKTNFGFFTAEALANQVGLRDAALHEPTATQSQRAVTRVLPDVAPHTPDQIAAFETGAWPGSAWRMIDDVRIVRDGGPHGLGFARGTKKVNPDEWFFAAHFYQDPVWPGSLGIEAFLQVLRAFAVERWGGGDRECRITSPMDGPHAWTYRGQVVPKNRHVEVDAIITRVDDDAMTLQADGFLRVDGLNIYAMRNFSIACHLRPEA
jgi:PfaB family protein